MPPGDAAGQSRGRAAAAGVASRAPVSAAAPPIYSPANFETTRTCTARAYRAVATAAEPDERDERRNYRGGPGRDPAAGSERRRRASCVDRRPGGRRSSARSAPRPPTVVDTAYRDAPGARPSPVYATWPVGSGTRPGTHDERAV